MTSPARAALGPVAARAWFRLCAAQSGGPSLPLHWSIGTVPALCGRVKTRRFDRDRRLQRVVECLANSGMQLPHLQQASAAACLERTYFSHWFPLQSGLHYLDWRRLLGVLSVLDILVERDLTQDQLASCSGLGSLDSFRRAMRGLTGLTLREVRNHIDRCVVTDVAFADRFPSITKTAM